MKVLSIYYDVEEKEYLIDVPIFKKLFSETETSLFLRDRCHSVLKHCLTAPLLCETIEPAEK